MPKFEAFREKELDAVNQAAAWHTERLKRTELVLPEIADGFVSSLAQYTVQLPEKMDHAKLQEEMKKAGIPTMVYYPWPMHGQGAFAGTDSAKADCPVTERLCRTVLASRCIRI